MGIGRQEQTRASGLRFISDNNREADGIGKFLYQRALLDSLSRSHGGNIRRLAGHKSTPRGLVLGKNEGSSSDDTALNEELIQGSWHSLRTSQLASISAAVTRGKPGSPLRLGSLIATCIHGTGAGNWAADKSSVRDGGCEIGGKKTTKGWNQYGRPG